MEKLENIGRMAPEAMVMLVCPVTRTALKYAAKTDELISRVTGLAYPIRDGVPIMIPEEAREL